MVVVLYVEVKRGKIFLKHCVMQEIKVIGLSVYVCVHAHSSDKG